MLSTANADDQLTFLQKLLFTKEKIIYNDSL